MNLRYLSIFLGNIVLLRDGQNVVYKPVQNKTGREIDENECEKYRHEHHDLGLRGIARRRRHPLLQQHGCSHYDCQNRNADGRLHIWYVGAELEQSVGSG